MSEFYMPNNGSIEIRDDFKTPIGYAACSLGLNNQKIALFGLFCRAYDERAPLVLPDIEIFESMAATQQKIPFREVFYLDRIKQFADVYGMAIVEDQAVPYDDINGWASFEYGARRLSVDASRGETVLNEFMGRFFRCLRPKIVDTPLFHKLFNGVFKDSDIKVTSQLRIEKDWVSYSKTDLQNLEGSGEDYLPSFQRIMEKIKNSCPDQFKLYIVCDEANLPLPKDEIRRQVYDKYGVYLLWKSDVLSKEELAGLSLLDLSIIDFEMSVASPIFVGITRSTFSMMACFEAFARRRKFVLNHFIYDHAGNFLLQRYDHGSANSPSSATNKLLLRQRLIPETLDDCYWPLSLTTHISNFGDFTTSGGSLLGVRGTPIVSGVRGDALKLIEGFQIDIVGDMPCGLEYRALTHGGWTSWVSEGVFVGSKERSIALLGFSIRLSGNLAKIFSCIYAGSFVGQSDLIEARDGLDCVTSNGAKLEAMHVVILPKL